MCFCWEIKNVSYLNTNGHFEAEDKATAPHATQYKLIKLFVII